MKGFTFLYDYISLVYFMDSDLKEKDVLLIGILVN